MSQPVPRPQGSPYTLPTAVRLSPDINYAQTTSLSQSNSHQSYIANKGTDAAPVVTGTVTVDGVETFLAPPVIPGGSSGSYFNANNPLSLTGSSQTVNVLTGFAGKLPASSSAMYALSVQCVTNDSFSFTTVGQLNVSSTGTITAFGFGGNAYQVSQNGAAVTSIVGADISMPNASVAGSSVLLGQSVTGAGAVQYNVYLYALAPTTTPV